VSIGDMNKLPAVFKKDGTVTAGNSLSLKQRSFSLSHIEATASGIVDGAVSIIVCSENYLKKHVCFFLILFDCFSLLELDSVGSVG
jgi:acetyl-CoA acetyltransferase